MAKQAKKAPKGTLKRVLSYLRGYRFYLFVSLLLAVSSVALTLWLPVLIGDAIEGQYAANNLHFAAAIAFILMVILLIAMAFMQRYANRRAAV